MSYDVYDWGYIVCSQDQTKLVIQPVAYGKRFTYEFTCFNSGLNVTIQLCRLFEPCLFRNSAILLISNYVSERIRKLL